MDWPSEAWREWFLQEIERRAVREGLDLQGLIMEIVCEWLADRGISLRAEDLAELEQLLRDCADYATSHLTGLPLQPTVAERLSRTKIVQRTPFDLPALAVQAGRLYEHLLSQEPTKDIVAYLRQQPIRRSDAVAIEHARTRAGIFLRPIYDQAGRIVPIQAELDPIRSAAARALRGHISPRQAAREIAATNRAQGNFRDMHRVLRTEMAEAVGQARFADAVERGADRLFRQTSVRACEECKRLFNANGKPVLYTRKEILDGEALGPNTTRPYHVRIGPIHPNCACSPWMRWVPAMEKLFAH